MRRRDFIKFTISSAAAWPLAVRAEKSSTPVVGFLNPSTPDAYPSALAAFHAGLRENGFIEGDNVAIAYRWAEGHADRLPALAADLVQVPVTVIAATGGGDAAFAAKAATKTIPVIFNSAGDPVKDGLVTSLNRPGGNLTGVGRVSVELMPKRFELLREAVPNAAPVAYLVEANSAVAKTTVVQDTARSVGAEIQVAQITTEANLENILSTLAKAGAKALLIGSSSFFNSHSKQLGELCVRYRLPAIYQGQEFVAAGGLMSYGPSLIEAYRIVGVYTGRVLKGERPADLPVQLQSKIDFTINLRTAKTLGITLPLPLLGRADEVIE
jgi:putative ABC transport system substrate-binding protein